MNIAEIEVTHKVKEKEWKEFLSRSEYATVYHTPEWKKTLEESFGYKPYYLFVKDESDLIVGMLPLFYVKSKLTGNRLSSLPFSHISGPVGEKPLKIPKLGKYLASSKSKLPIVFLGLGALLLLPEKNRRKRRRRGVTISTTATYLIVISILTAGFFIVGTTNWRIINISYASTLGGGERENWYLPGSVVEKNITVQNFAKYRMIGVVEGKIINKTTFALNGGDKVMLPATIIVPNETRIYTEKIRVYMYYPLLPTGVVERMFEKSPYLPLAVEAMIVFLGLLVLKPLLIGDEEEIIIGRFRR